MIFDQTTNSFRLTQRSLDGIVNQQPRPPMFSIAGLLNYIIEFIVEEDEVSNLACTIIIVLI
jgi:hypothetical protein